MNSLAKKKLIIDARMVGPVPHGIARYVSLIARSIESMRSSLPFDVWYLVDLKKNPSPEQTNMPRQWCVESSASFLSLKELWTIPAILRRERADLFWSPSFSSYLWLPCLWMVTVHDLNHLHFGGLFQKLYYEWIVKPFCLKARQCMTVSRFSQGELARWLRIPADRIQVVPNAIDPAFLASKSFSRSEGAEAADSQSYFLSFGSSKPHKNVSFLARSYQQYRFEQKRRGFEPFHLWICGVGSGAELGLTESECEGIRWIQHIPEAELRGHIQSAAAVVFPSLYEGFGLPPVEAFAVGARVLVSDIPAHREGLSVVQKSVLWFDPRAEATLVQCLVEATETKDANAEAVELLREQWSFDRLSGNVARILAEV
ncbi:MAG: glycosyltransferase family 4 protein [Bdellovibrionales bacterium]|nr:glycosyltransferase family 4 protein [Bdellovibrionales bacterium]